MRISDLVARTGLHENTLREHLNALVSALLVERAPLTSRGRGRPALGYSAARGPASDLDPPAREYAGLALVLARQVRRLAEDPTSSAEEAGWSWGQQLARGDGPVISGEPARGSREARRRVVGLLGRLGFAPTTNARLSRARLTTCPLLSAAREEPDVVCSVHLGLVKGALSEWGGDPQGVSLHPFAEPGACILHLLGRPA